MEYIEQEVATITSDGEVIILRDFNTRTTMKKIYTSPLGVTWVQEEFLNNM